jgi:secretion/DNA translocation related TadE-like protein
VSAPRDQRGGATVLVVAMAGVLMLIGTAVAVVIAVVAAHRSAQSAADLAALSGARAVASGGDGCAAATAAASANRARLSSCAVTGRVVEVRVQVDGPRWLGQSAELTALARAGPAS